MRGGGRCDGARASWGGADHGGCLCGLCCAGQMPGRQGQRGSGDEGHVAVGEGEESGDGKMGGHVEGGEVRPCRWECRGGKREHCRMKGEVGEVTSPSAGKW